MANEHNRNELLQAQIAAVNLQAIEEKQRRDELKLQANQVSAELKNSEASKKELVDLEAKTEEQLNQHLQGQLLALRAQAEMLIIEQNDYQNEIETKRATLAKNNTAADQSEERINYYRSQMSQPNTFVQPKAQEEILEVISDKPSDETTPIVSPAEETEPQFNAEAASKQIINDLSELSVESALSLANYSISNGKMRDVLETLQNLNSKVRIYKEDNSGFIEIIDASKLRNSPATAHRIEELDGKGLMVTLASIGEENTQTLISQPSTISSETEPPNENEKNIPNEQSASQAETIEITFQNALALCTAENGFNDSQPNYNSELRIGFNGKNFFTISSFGRGVPQILSPEEFISLYNQKITEMNEKQQKTDQKLEKSKQRGENGKGGLGNLEKLAKMDVKVFFGRLKSWVNNKTPKLPKSNILHSNEQSKQQSESPTIDVEAEAVPTTSHEIKLEENRSRLEQFKVGEKFELFNTISQRNVTVQKIEKGGFVLDKFNNRSFYEDIDKLANNITTEIYIFPK